jgi:GT2 family glycosyltransferase
VHQIAAVRNAGAREALGEVFIFVDADTLVSEATLRATLRALRAGAAGGGAWVKIEGPVPRAVRTAAEAFAHVWFGLCRWAAGCFIFVRRDAFEAVGGFNERYYVGEELYFSRAIKRLGPFAVLREAVVSSGRKARLYGPRHMLWTALALLLRGPKMWRDRDALDMWYDGRREGGERY